jgi:RND family efflux transporter MFP subunit
MSRRGIIAPSVLALVAALTATAAGAAEFTVEPVSIPEMKAVFGEVRARTVVPARARIGGTLHSVSVTEGSEVAAGAVIARVVDDKLALQRDAAEANVRQATSSLAKAVADLDRAKQLLAKGVTSQSQLDQATTAHDVATSQLAAAEAALAVVDQQSREGDVLAPAAGRVLTVPVTQGSVVLAGDEIARVASGQYYLRLSLPERHAASIHEGDAVTIGGRGLSAGSGEAEALQGRVVKVYPEITDGRVTADVEVAGIGDYFVGERTLVTIPVGRRDALLVPVAALSSRHGVDYVRLADGAEVAVILGERRDLGGEARIEILTGLRPGDHVLVPDGTK